MKQLSLPSGLILMVEVPKGFYWYSIVGGRVRIIDRVGDYVTRIIPPGNWQIVGKGDQLTEDDWKGIVDVQFHPFATKKYGYSYKGQQEYSAFKSATESGLSLIASHSMKPETTLILKQVK